MAKNAIRLSLILSFLECLFLCLFLLLCILAMFAIPAIAQIASKTEKLWSAQKTSSQICVWRWYDRQGVVGGGASGTALTGQGILSLSFLPVGQKNSSTCTGEPRMLAKGAGRNGLV